MVSINFVTFYVIFVYFYIVFVLLYLFTYFHFFLSFFPVFTCKYILTVKKVSDDALETTGNPQLTEISAKFSLILTAVNEQTALLREVIGSKSTLSNDELVKNIGTVIKSIETEMKCKSTTSQQVASAESFQQGTEIVVEAEAMRIKASIGTIWEQKLNARKDAYWAKTRNEGFVSVHQKWIQEGTPLIIPKKLQKNRDKK